MNREGAKYAKKLKAQSSKLKAGRGKAQSSKLKDESRKKAVFRSRRDRKKFLKHLESANKRYHAVIHAYCLMDNHYHILLETASGNMPKIMAHINGAYTNYL
ncbi:MAG: transposase [Deltaproteobacteria bacterium]|nr:transposase [Deltaproteobacteria bacterium]